MKSRLPLKISTTGSLQRVSSPRLTSEIQPISFSQKTRPQRILDFDIETRLVGFYRGGKFQPDGCEPTALAWSWLDQPKVHVVLQKERPVPDMIEQFRPFYEEADLVIGHYITRFDLPIINGMCLEFGLPLWPAKLVSDTCTHLVRRAGFSKAQENLAGMLDIPAGKFHMADFNWRSSTRLEDEGVELTRRRVMDDVKQHKALYETLRDRGALKPPKVWKP